MSVLLDFRWARPALAALLVLVVEAAAQARVPDDPLYLSPPLASSAQCGFLGECGRFDAIGLHVLSTLGLRGSRDRSFVAVSDWVRMSLTLLDVVEAGGALGGHFTHDEQGAGHFAGAAARLFVRGRLYPLPWVKLSSAGWVISASYERSFVSQKLGAGEPPGFDTNTARLTLSRSFWRLDLDGGAGVVFANPTGGRHVTLDLFASIGLNLFIDPNEPTERLKLMLQAVYRPALARPDGTPSLQETYVLGGVEAQTASGYHVGLGLGPHVLGSRAGALLLLSVSASWGPRYQNPVMVRLNELGRRVPRLWMDLFYVDPVLEADGCVWSDAVPEAPRLRIICVGAPDPKDPKTIRLWDGRSLAVGTHLWIDPAGGLLTDKQESVAKLDPETLKGALAAQKLAQEFKAVADCTETYALRKLPLPDELRMFTDQPAAVGLMYAALEANRLRKCQASGQVKGQSALSWLMLLGKLNPAGKGTRAGSNFSAGPKGTEHEAEHVAPSQPRDEVAEHERPLPPAPRRGSVKIEGKALQKEIDFAREQADNGHDVIVRGTAAQGYDYWIDGVKWEYKRLDSSRIEAVRQNLRIGIPQGAGRVIIDGRYAGLKSEDAQAALTQHSSAGRMKNAVEIRVLTIDGEINWRP